MNKFLISLVVMLAFPVLSGKAIHLTSSIVSKDTSRANQLFLLALKLEEEAKFDSAILLYTESAKTFKKARYFENYLKCKNNIISVHRLAGRNDGLVGKAEKNIDYALKKFGKAAPISAACYNIAGNVYADQNHHDTALYYFRTALNIWRNSIDYNDTRIAHAHKNMGVIFSSKGIYDSARVHVGKAIEILKIIHGDEHPDLAGCYNSLGIMAYHEGKYDACGQYFMEALKIREKAYGTFHPFTAEAYNNYGALLMAKAEYDTALVFHQKAYEIRTRTLPGNHPYIPLSLNNIGNAYMLKGDLEEALSYHKRALDKRLSIYKNDHPDLAMSYTNSAILLRKMGRYEEALHYFTRALEIQKEVFGADNPHCADAFNNVGTANADLGNYDTCLVYFKKALDLRKRIGKNTPRVSNSYNNIGAIYKYRGDYDLALSYYRKSLEILYNVYEEYHPDHSRTYDNIGEVFLIREKYDTAMYYFKKTLEIDTTLFGKDNIELAPLYLNRGTTYGKLNLLDNEFSDYKRGLALILREHGEIHPMAAKFFANMAMNLSERQNSDSAIVLQKKALQINQQVYPPLHPTLAIAYRNMGEIYEKANLTDSCLLFYHKSLKANYGRELTMDNIDKALVLDEFEFTITLLNICALKYKLYQETMNSLFLKDILEIYTYIPKLTAGIISDFLLEETKIELLNKLSDNSLYAIDAAYILYRETGNNVYFIKALEISELNKAFVLQNTLFKCNGEGYSNVPGRLLSRKKNITGYIQYLQQKVHDNKGNSREFIYPFEKQVDSLMICLRNVNDSITVYLPGMGKSSMHTRENLFFQVKSKLEQDESLISYYVADTILFSFLLTADTMIISRQVADTTSTRELVFQYLSSLKKFEKKEMQKSSAELHEILIGGFLKHLVNTNRLVVIPDKELLFLPFETLQGSCSTANAFSDFSNLDYLIRDFDITYNYSIGLWCYEDDKVSTIDKQLIAFAPVFSNESDTVNISVVNKDLGKNISDLDIYRGISHDGIYYNELPYSLAEADTLKRLCDRHGWRAEMYLQNNASEKNFKSYARDYSFIHVATHGFVDNDNPGYSGLIFSMQGDEDYGSEFSGSMNDGVLYANELYLLDLNAELVVLSACETGAGKFEKGEGILGLIRGFLTAGASNVLFSFWKTGDKNSLFFMNSFYRHLFKHGDCSLAIRQAKLDMMNNPRTSYPLFWGGYALIGK